MVGQSKVGRMVKKSKTPANGPCLVCHGLGQGADNVGEVLLLPALG